MAKKQLSPGFAISVCIARTLHDCDPKFLAALKANVAEFQKAQPRGETTWETLQIFWDALHDSQLFPRGS
jgi:hypothetical protein